MDLTKYVEVAFFGAKICWPPPRVYLPCMYIVYKSTYTYTGRDIIILISNSKEQVSTIER